MITLNKSQQNRISYYISGTLRARVDFSKGHKPSLHSSELHSLSSDFVSVSLIPPIMETILAGEDTADCDRVQK